MDTRALRNPYHDYDGSQALFDVQGKVNCWGGGPLQCACFVGGFLDDIVFPSTSDHSRVCPETEQENQRAVGCHGEWVEVC